MIDDLPPVPLLQTLLPDDVSLPALVRFVPNVQLRRMAEAVASDALAVDVTGPDGLAQADAALALLRDCQRDITEHFREPCEIAHTLHKELTSRRAEWLAFGDAAIQTISHRIWSEDQRLKRLADEERRRAQFEADRQAREDARKAAKEAAAAEAPRLVLAALEDEAATAMAPPVHLPDVAPLRMTSIVELWNVRICGTLPTADPHPSIETLTPMQWESVKQLLVAVLEGRESRPVLALNWGYLTKRAQHEKAAFTIPGFEAYKEGRTRAKPGRRNR
jgi:hypothetical protein